MINNRLIHKPKDLIYKTALAFALRILGAVSGFILNLAIARNMTIEQAGFYFLAHSILQILVTISLTGLTLSFIRFIGSYRESENWQKINSIYKTGTLWVLLFAGSISAIFYCVSPWFATTILGHPALAEVLQAMSPGIVLFAVVCLNAYALQAVGDIIKSIATLNILIPLFLTIILFTGYAKNANTTASFYSLACLLVAFLSLVWWLRKPGASWQGANGFPLTTLSQSCLPLWWVCIMTQVIQWGGQLIAGFYVSGEDIAILAIAQRTVLLTSFIPIAINFVTAPKFAALYQQKKKQELKTLAMTTTRMMVLYSLPIAFIMILFPQSVMAIFGEQYKNGAALIVVLIIGQFFSILTGSTHYLLSMSGHERDLRNTYIIACPLIIVLAIVLIPIYGVIGAAIASATTVVVQNSLAAMMVKKRLGFYTLCFWKR